MVVIVSGEFTKITTPRQELLFKRPVPAKPELNNNINNTKVIAVRVKRASTVYNIITLTLP